MKDTGGSSNHKNTCTGESQFRMVRTSLIITVLLVFCILSLTIATADTVQALQVSSPIQITTTAPAEFVVPPYIGVIYADPPTGGPGGDRLPPDSGTVTVTPTAAPTLLPTGAGAGIVTNTVTITATGTPADFNAAMAGSASGSGSGQGAGSQSSASGQVAVENLPPKTTFSSTSSSGQVPLKISFDAGLSKDPDGYITSYMWDFGDGATVSGKTVTHTYSQAGTFKVILTTKDNLGGTSSYSSQIIAISAPPTTSATSVNQSSAVQSPPVTTQNSTPPMNWGLIAGIALLAIIILVIVVVLWTREKIELVPVKKSIPCDGVSQIILKVRFSNLFGRPRVQKKERQVELTTTSGNIENIFIPAGKDSGDAILTSSNECGPVTVTAQSQQKTVQTIVDFEGVISGIDIEASPESIIADGKSTSTLTFKLKNDQGKHFTSLEDRTLMLSTTLGSINKEVVIPAKSLFGSTVLTAGLIGGKAIVTAVAGTGKGEKVIELMEPAKRFCMHCGSGMGMEVQRCPKCANTPPSGMDTKSCPSCEAVLPQTAKYCDKCGARQSQ